MTDDKRASASPGAGLSLRDISVSFGGVSAVQSVSFDVSIGEVMGLVGPNGAGKSSLLNAVGGLIASSGGIFVDGRDASALPAHRRVSAGVSRAFQNVELFGSLSVIENIMLGRYHLMNYSALEACVRWGRARRQEFEHRTAAEEVIEFFEIERWRNQAVGSLSFGVQKIVGLARAVAAKPRVLLLDEVGSGLNREEREHLGRFILRLQAQGAMAIVWVEHDVRMVRELADRVTVLHYGKQLGTGGPEEMLGRSDVREAFVGIRLSDDISQGSAEVGEAIGGAGKPRPGADPR